MKNCFRNQFLLSLVVVMAVYVFIFSVNINASEVDSSEIDCIVDNEGDDEKIVIPNSSLEQRDEENPDLPEGWGHNSWGNNDAAFTYLDEGHTGERSVKVRITEYTDGDGKWFFNPIELTPNKEYMFSNYYRADVESRVVLAITLINEEIRYIELPRVPASETWNKYEASFIMPDDGEKLTVYHFLAQVGYIITDDYSITVYTPTGFDRGIVTLTFDDAWEENAFTALPMMEEYGFKSTQYYATTFIENPRVPEPVELIRKFIDAGHELGSHSVTHPDLAELDADTLDYELLNSRDYLDETFDVYISHFAVPFGSYNTVVNENIMRHYTSHRTVDSGFNTPDRFDISRLKVQNILKDTSAQEVARWVERAKNYNYWLILVYHSVDDNPGHYDTTPELFAGHLRVINEADIPVLTVTEALYEIIPQLDEIPYDAGLPGSGHITGKGVDVQDALMVLRHVTGLTELTYKQQTAADVTGSRSINAGDAILILRHIVGLANLPRAG